MKYDRLFDFSEALNLMKEGCTLTRKKWCIESLSEPPVVQKFQHDSDPSPIFICIDRDNHVAKWSPSAEDMLAEDWMLI